MTDNSTAQEDVKYGEDGWCITSKVEDIQYTLYM